MKEDSKSNQSNIFECSASYYNAIKKKWESGSFILNKFHIQFIFNDNSSDQFHLCLPLSTITSIEKRQSTLIYPSLVICIKTEKHWFGSFMNRDAVYNLLELFWRESLNSKPYKKTKSHQINGFTSPLGKELLNLFHESENTLVETANDLSEQNHQLYVAEEAVEDVNNDITIAKQSMECLSHLSLTFFENRTLKDLEYKIHKYKVTFSFSNNKDNIYWEKGALIITEDIFSLNQEDKTQLQVTKNELEEFQVLSPWEFCIVHNFAGIKKVCYFMCAQLSRILKFLSTIHHYKEKVVYVDDDSSTYETASCSSSSSFNSNVNSPPSPIACSKLPKSSTLDSSQTEANLNTLTNEEVEELSKILQNLQTLAAEVYKEQENQTRRIDSLVINIAKTESRIEEKDETVKKTT